MRALAVEGAPHNIRCNSIHPTTVNTPVINNPVGWDLFSNGQATTEDDVKAARRTRVAACVRRTMSVCRSSEPATPAGGVG